MDSRWLIVVVALVVIYWLVRNRFLLHSQAGGKERAAGHPLRRSGDRTLSARWSERTLDDDDGDTDETLLPGAVKRVSAPSDGAVMAGSGAATSLLSEQDGTAHRRVHDNNVPTQTDVDRLSELLQQRDRILARNKHAMEEVEKLKKKLYDKGREMEMLQQACARSDAALAHYRTRAQRTAMLEQQLAEAREQTVRKEQELAEARKSLEQQKLASQAVPVLEAEHDMTPGIPDVVRRKNQVSKKQLARELLRVEKQAQLARQNSLELRRIRGELESVCEDRASAKTRIAELQVRVQAQQRALESARETVETIDETEHRHDQTEQLRQQLARLSGAPILSDDSDSGSQDVSVNDGKR